MVQPGRFKERWIQPVVFLANNPVSLIGIGLTTASALILIGFWVIDVFGHGGSANPYVGIILNLCLPALFVTGLMLIPIGILLHRRKLRAAGQLPAEYPRVDLSNPVFRNGLNFLIVATFINFVIVGTTSYRGVAYMDQPSFCGQGCHVMAPEWSGYHAFPHSQVACTECHIASGLPGYVHAKLNGAKQLVQVVVGKYPRPIMANGKVPAASSTDATNQTVPWVAKVNDDGSTVEYLSSDAKQPVSGQKHQMDCIDCHNRAAHSFNTPEKSLNKAMNQGEVDPSLPFVHKEGLALIKADYSSQADAESKINAGLEDFYRTQHPDVWNQKQSQVERAAKALSTIYGQNVFPFMKVTWGTHPNNLGHNDYPGCFRCHDGSHNTKDGSMSIDNDCTACHNLLAVDEANPKQLADLGLQ